MGDEDLEAESQKGLGFFIKAKHSDLNVFKMKLQSMQEWTQQIDEITQQFTQKFGSLSTDQLNWKLDPNTWSIAQNIDHLITINETYFPITDAIREGNYRLPFTAKFGFLVRFFGNQILKASKPERKNKMKTFPVWEPASSGVPAGIMERFEAHQEALKNWIEDAQDLAAQGQVISSPANKYIVYKLAKAFEIIVNHERRHFNQAKEVYEALP